MKNLLFLIAFTLCGLGQAAAEPDYDRVRTAVTLDALADSIVVTGNGYGTAGFQITGTWSGTIQFYSTINGTTWVGAYATNSQSRASDTTTTENGLYFVGTSGSRYIMVKFSAYTSGAAVVAAITTDDPITTTSASGGGGGAEGSVDVLSIAAGNNNIGNVDVVTLPALAAGTANIGDVDVASIAAGDNNIGNVDIVSLPTVTVNSHAVTNAGTFAVQNTAALPSGTNNIGDVDVLTMPTITVNAHAVTNAGTFATQIDGAALTSLQLTDNLVLAEDAAHADGGAGLLPFAVRRDANTSLVGTDGDLAPFQVDATGSLKVAITAGAGSGGTSIADDAAFTPASTSVTPIAGFADETSPDLVNEGDAGAVRMTLARALHVNLRNAAGDELSVGGQYAEDAAHASGDQLMMAGAVRRDAPASSAGTDGDNATLNTDAAGRLWVTSGPAPAATWSYPAAAGGLVNTTGVTVKAAAGAGVRNYVTAIQCINSHQTTGTEIAIRDGASGTVLWRGWAQAAGGGFSAPFAVPLRGTANTLLEIAEVTTTATAGVLCNLQGYESAQ